VIEQASGDLIARMDADDISHSDRISRELEVLERNPNAGLVGSLFAIIDSRGHRLRDPELWRVKRHTWFAPFAHGSIMFRRDLFDAIGGYREQAEFWEDQDLVLRMAVRSDILVIPEELYEYRQSPVSTRATSAQERVERAVDLMYRCMRRLDKGRGYDDLLDRRGDRKLDPRVFISLGSIQLWSGGRPRLLGRLLRRGKLGFDLRTASAICWTALASTSPSALRTLLSLVHRMRSEDVGASGSTAPIVWKAAERPPIAAISGSQHDR